MSKKVKQKIALAVDNVMSEVVEVVSEVEKVVLTLVEQFIKLFDYVDDSVIESLAVEKDTDARRSKISLYLLEVAHENKLLDSIKSTSTFREKLYALIQNESDAKSKLLFADNKRLENVVSKKQCLEFLKHSNQAKVVMCAMYSKLKCCKELYELK